MSDFQFFMPILKMDTERRTVSGYASTPTKDGDGEIVTLDAIRGALPGYMDYGNIREMHALKAVGVAQEANIDTKGLFLTAKIVDDEAWKKCLEGVYKGFSIGGRKLDKKGNKITEIEMTEISVVDRPANPDCRITVAKSMKTLGDAQGHLLKAKKAKKAEENVSPDDDSKQNNKAAGTKCEAHGTEDCQECAKMALKKDDDMEMACKAHGVKSCEKCAIEKREFDAKQRTSAADSGAALPDGSFPIENKSDLHNAIQAFGRAKDKAKAKAHIKARAKSLGAESELSADWAEGPDAKGDKKAKKTAKKAAKVRLQKALDFVQSGDPFVLRKGMSTVGTLAYSFDSLRSAQRSLLIEGKREGKDKKDHALADRLGAVASDLAAIISQKAEHEGQEAKDLSDADDLYVTSMLGEDFGMSVDKAISGDPLANAIVDLVKRAAAPSRAQRMAMADDNVKKSRKAMKAAKESIEEAHKMCKAAYISKAAKKDDKKDDKDDFDHEEMMGKLQKAYQDMDKALTMGKAARENIAKASARSGQRGEEAGDAESGFYEVPAGVTDISPSAMAGAAPGTKAGGSQPPMYPGDGAVYAGKAAGSDLRKFMRKDGSIDGNVAALLMEKAATDGELESLRRMPSGRQRPHSFDVTKVLGGTDSGNDLRKSLFEGVDVGAIGSGDEIAHSREAAKAAGNFLLGGQFGKSILDPSFRGMAAGK